MVFPCAFGGSFPLDSYSQHSFGLGRFCPVLVALVFRPYNIWLYRHLSGASALTPSVCLSFVLVTWSGACLSVSGISLSSTRR